MRLEEKVSQRRSAVGLVVLVSLSALLGCSSISVSSDYDESTDFNELKTFAWMKGVNEGKLDLGVKNPLVRSRIQNAIAAELEAKGYRQVFGRPDFHVAYHARTQERLDLRSMPMSGPMRGPRWGGAYADLYQYEEGTLIIDLVEEKTQHLIWRGVGKGAVDWRGDPDQKTKLINEAVQKILAEFPPKQSR